MGGGFTRNLVLLGLLILTGLLFRSVLADATLPPADLVIANGPDPRSLDPAVTTAIADGRVLSSLFEGLLDVDPRTLEPVPALAATMPEVSEDGLTWTFAIRDGLKWSDGEPLDATGLRWSFLRFLDPSTAARFTELLYGVRGAKAFNDTGDGQDAVGIEAPDARTLIFRLERPVPHFAAILTLFPLYPVPRHAVLRFGAQWVKPEHYVCNGPFRPVFWRVRDRIRVVKNPHYRCADEVALQTVDYLCTESAAAQLNLYVNDRADIITEVPTAAVPELIRRYGEDATGEFRPTARLGTFFYRINTTRSPFTNRKVRLALSLAVDRQSIVENVTRAGELPARSLVPPGTRCASVEYEPPLVARFDLARAKTLLAEGLQELNLTVADVPVFEVLYSADVVDQAVAEVLQKQWETLGLRCRLVNMDGGSIRTAIRQLDYAIGRSSWIGDFNDPSNFLELFVSDSGGNRTGFEDAAYDSSITEAAPRAASDAERARLFRAAETRLLAEAPFIPIYHYVSRSMVKPWVRGYHRNVLDWHPPRWWSIER
ncbi:MAG: hypothetical protein CMJ83_20710 [Planctomycetes bacterium]|nr:hypothetical protein [Planctomycetota bacterium]